MTVTSSSITKKLLKLPLLSLDVGGRRIGVAVSDSLGLTCHGVQCLYRQHADWQKQALDIAHKYSCKGIVVGLALNMDGSEGTQAADCKAAAAQFQKFTDLPVKLWDERLSSWSARERLREQGLREEKVNRLVDQTAAAIILEDFLAANPVHNA